ncbi:hypothetical protein K1T71_014295 [Dendrolimus kikuchii]|uniref:Uncharacterized protein n=1 Tax=Dendrolimus kikuchii TaxID=765133 RepID=A0ACC1CFU3_9NEOP|nr:hypothetical protein K1T71_014295 [Dendrolimus kikuchii]
MASKRPLCFCFLLIICVRVDSASLFERSYEYVMNWGKSLTPTFMSLLDCFGEDDAWSCAKERASKILDVWDDDVQQQRRMWQDAADAEVVTSGRSFEELPSKLGREVEDSLNSLVKAVHHGVARALAKKHHEGGIDTITISTGNDKKKMKKKKPKPPKIHLLHPMVMPLRKIHKEKGREFPIGVQSWVIGTETDQPGDIDQVDSVNVSDNDSSDSDNSENDVNDDNLTDDTSVKELADENFRQGRGVIQDLWKIGEQAVDAVAEHAIETENAENGISDKSSIAEQRGKKKKKKKAILKLLILGAVLKAKIGTLLQILSFKLQVKFFIIALLGLGINLARLWIDIKNKHKEQPQKVIYYEHAQHQHHYEHEEEPEHGWGPWSRSLYPEEHDHEESWDKSQVQPQSPYHAQERVQYPNPFFTKV